MACLAGTCLWGQLWDKTSKCVQSRSELEGMELRLVLEKGLEDLCPLTPTPSPPEEEERISAAAIGSSKINKPWVNCCLTSSFFIFQWRLYWASTSRCAAFMWHTGLCDERILLGQHLAETKFCLSMRSPSTYPTKNRALVPTRPV